ncbi:MAG: hypothetical protein HQM10_14885 [Candidatus Riflebacteria bacterium]|nr:hypothetical protein [Candidatus Riflebacteria bacterium]
MKYKLLSGKKSGMAIVIVLMAVTTSLIFATFLLQRSLSQGNEKLVSRDRSQLELLCHSAIEIAKLKIKAHPSELYTAFRFMKDEPVSKRTNTLYEMFLSDLKLETLDSKLKSENASMTARVVLIERLGISKKTTGLGTGYVEDYYRITASASNIIKTGLESDVVMQVTIQIKKLEG